MTLPGFQVELLEVVGVYGHQELSLDIAPRASKLQISFFFSCCSPHQNLTRANRWEWPGESSARLQGPRVRQNTGLILSWAHK